MDEGPRMNLIDWMLEQNRKRATQGDPKLPYEQRLHYAMAPQIHRANGGQSTHMMASGDNLVYPTITQDPQGILVERPTGPDGDFAARRHAVDTGNYKRFSTPGQAEAYSHTYKQGTSIDSHWEEMKRQAKLWELMGMRL